MTDKMQSLALAPVGNLDSYIRAANAWPMLSADEERALAEKLHYHGDLEAAKTLILSHLRFVVHIARNYAGYGLPQADLIQEGNIGLMKAVRRFNPEVGVRLVSFAVHWIKAEIHEYVLRNWRIVKVATTKAQRKLFFNLRKTKQRLGWFNQDEVEMVARELGVTSKDVREMESRMAAQDMTFDLSSDDDSDSQPMDPVGTISSIPIHFMQYCMSMSVAGKVISTVCSPFFALIFIPHLPFYDVHPIPFHHECIDDEP